MKKILWLDLNSSYSHSSMALPALHAQLDGDAGWEWTVVPATINENPGDIVAKVTEQSPDIIAATCWLFTHEHLVAVLARCSVILPDASIILGGPEFLGDNETFLRHHPYVDCVFRGEGEISFPVWLERWNRPETWTEVPGVCWIGADGVYHDGGLAKSKDFDALVLPERSRFFNWSKAFVQLETTRGCFNTCAFCVSGGEKPVRVLPMEKVRQRVAEIYSHGIRDVRMLDRTFNYDNKRAIEMLDLFREYYPEMHFHLEVHPALLTPELKAKLAELPAGLLHIEAGIQSLDAEVLKVSGRRGSLEASLDGLKYLASLDNLIVHADLIAGLPLYHLHQIFEDVRSLASFNVGEIQLESLKVLPGTEMRRRADELGLKYSPLPPYEILETPAISAHELRRAMQLSRMVDFYYNSDSWQKVFRKIILAEDGFMEAFLDHLIQLSVIGSPLSQERRGIILYEYCREHCPQYLTDITMAWTEAGWSLKKEPAEKIFRVKKLARFIGDEHRKGQISCFPEYLSSYPFNVGTAEGDVHELTVDEQIFLSERFRLYYLPLDLEDGILYGFDADQHQPEPVFKCRFK